MENNPETPAKGDTNDSRLNVPIYTAYSGTTFASANGLNKFNMNDIKKKINEMNPKKLYLILIGFVVLFFFILVASYQSANPHVRYKKTTPDIAYASYNSRSDYAPSNWGRDAHVRRAGNQIKRANGRAEMEKDGGEAATTKESSFQESSEKRYIVKNGDVTVSVRSSNGGQDDKFKASQEFAKLITESVSKRNGFIASRSESGFNYIYLSARIPVDVVEEFVQDIVDLCSSAQSPDNSILSARVNHLSLSSSDETEKILDWDVREKSLRASHARMLELLKDAKDIKDILEIEKEVSRITFELENILSQSKSLIKKATMSQMNISIEPDFSSDTHESNDTFPFRLLSTIYDATTSLLLLIENVIFFAIYVAVYALPVTLLGTCIALCIKRE